MVITGASSGIGLVTARMAAKKGARLVLAARNEEALQKLCEEIQGQGGKAIYVVADVGSESDVARIGESAIEAFGRFDTWVNVAGVSIFGRCMEVSIEDMQRMFDTNFWGVVYGSRAAVAHFQERNVGAALINVGSFFGNRATPLQSTYAASKHAVHGWTDALRMELEHDHVPVSVTLIHPGRIDTPYNDHAQNYEQYQPAHHDMIYAPETVAEAIVHAAQHPRRDMFVGFQSKLLTVLGGLSPRLADRFMEGYMFRSQLSHRPARANKGLHEHGYGLHERGTHEGRWYRDTSLYVKASKHPALAAATVATLGIGAIRLLSKRR
ncbi:putative oxidoreductase YxnA [Kushneria pakistanensis]|uniref:Oxidoreductase YxnA n=2 Tax=Kushneria pakistanensis TaxID=1508770 RepID=A0ABQ3FCL2_9GAMM|nr:putative oxidoreductase YxnA [Kushneria pakistanensis]